MEKFRFASCPPLLSRRNWMQCWSSGGGREWSQQKASLVLIKRGEHWALSPGILNSHWRGEERFTAPFNSSLRRGGEREAKDLYFQHVIVKCEFPPLAFVFHVSSWPEERAERSSGMEAEEQSNSIIENVTVLWIPAFSRSRFNSYSIRTFIFI